MIYQDMALVNILIHAVLRRTFLFPKCKLHELLFFCQTLCFLYGWFPGNWRDKTKADILVYIPNDDTKNNPSVDYNWTTEPTNQNSVEVPKDVKSTFW